MNLYGLTVPPMACLRSEKLHVQEQVRKAVDVCFHAVWACKHLVLTNIITKRHSG